MSDNPETATPNHPLDGIFHPCSIAVVGASSKADNWATKGFLQPQIDFGFDGRLFPINPSATPVMGLTAYPRVTDIPGPVDYAIISVPSGQVLQCIEDCTAKRVKTVCVYAAGFAESGAESGKLAQAKIVELARRAGTRILGPNCIGIYCPGGHITFNPNTPKDPGHVGLISQSGRYASEFVAMSAQRGVRFSKGVSYGNASDINETDLLDYLGSDEGTHVIAAYMEGIRGGRRFAEVLRRVAPAKPVIILKGGFTDAGRRAARSHTASLSGSQELWQALLRQSRAIPATDLEEMSDLAMTFQFVSNLAGTRVAVVGAGGGASVLVSDFLSRAGFEVPAFSEEIQQKLHEFIPTSGTGVANPVDFSPQTAGDPVLTPMAVGAVGALPIVDLVLLHYGLGPFATTERVRQFCKGVIDAARKIKKPVVVVLEWPTNADAAAMASDARDTWVGAGICVFPTLVRAAHCLGKRAAWLRLTA